MNYRELGTTGIEISEVSMGLWNVSGDLTWGSQAEREAVETIESAIEAGINFFDTAEAYGDGYAERLLVRALDDYDREELTIATEASPEHHHRSDLRAACEASLERLGVDYVDVYYLHWPNHDVPFEETMEGVQELQEEGLIRVPACSNFGVRDLNDLLEHGRVEANQLPYGLLWRAIEYEILPECRTRDVGVACYSPIAQGMLAGKFDSPEEVPEGRARTRHFSNDREYARHDEDGAEEATFETVDRIREICEDAGVDMVQASLAWLLSRDGVGTVIAGARTPEQIRTNARASDISLDDETRDRLADATEDLKEELGPNPDVWQSDSRYR